jgi:hypothetical protein
MAPNACIAAKAPTTRVNRSIRRDSFALLSLNCVLLALNLSIAEIKSCNKFA